MKLSVFPSARQTAAAAAATLVAQLQERPSSVLGLPTGRTTLEIYAEIVKAYDAGLVDFGRVHTLNLDEFLGLASDDLHSYCAFMQRHLFSRVNLPAAHVHFLDGNARDLLHECIRYEELIAGLGGIDFLLLGVGANGHIGFNEPSRALRARTHVAQLTPQTRRSNAALFDHMARKVPGRALSMGIGTILGAKRIVLAAMGASKARAIASIFSGAVTTAVPATFLQLHPDVHVIVDRAAAARLPRLLREPTPRRGSIAGAPVPATGRSRASRSRP